MGQIEFQGGNVLAKTLPGGRLVIQTVGSLDAEFAPEEAERLAGFIADEILPPPSEEADQQEAPAPAGGKG